MSKKTNLKKSIVTLSLFYSIIILFFWIITPIGDDMMFHLMRIGELGRELRRGTFPVYMFKDVYSYFGYPLPVFYCSIFIYPFAGLVCLGASAIFAYKVMVTAILVASFFSAYFSIFRWKNNKEFAVAGAFVYGIQPYFLIDLFVRAAIGEALAFIFIPIVLLGFWLAISGENSIEAITYLALGMTGVVCSHVISTVLMIITLLALFVIECIKKNITFKAFLRMLTSGIISILLSLWYVAPLIEQAMSMSFRAEGENDFAKGTVGFISLLLPMHLNIILSSVMHVDLRPSQVGGAILVVVLFVIYAAISGIMPKLPRVGRSLLGLYMLLSCCLMISPLWIPLGKILGFMQFPWRFFLIISVIGTMAVIISLDAIRDNAVVNHVLNICICAAGYVLITFFAYFALRGVLYNVTDGKVGSADTGVIYTTETSDDLYLSSNVTDDIFTVKRSISLPEDGTIDYEYEIDTDEGLVILSIDNNRNNTDQWIEFPFLMYKGYTATNIEDQTQYPVRMSDRGLVEVLLPGGFDGDIQVSYTGTIIQRVSFYISIISVVVLIVLLGAGKGYLCKLKKA